MTTTHPKYRAKIIEFRHLWLSVEHVVGNAYLPLFAEAQELSEFVADIDSQSNPLFAVLHETYRRAKCTSLNAAINPFIVLDVLGDKLYEQKNRDDVDVTLIDLIERIGLHICQKFIDDYPSKPHQETSHPSTQEAPLSSGNTESSQAQTRSAEIVRLSYFRKSH